MSSIITPPQAKRLLVETIKGSPRIQNPGVVVAHAEFIEELVMETIEKIRATKIDFDVDDDEMRSASILHDIGYCFAENPYHHPHIGGDFLRKRGYHRIAKIIETHTYAPEAVTLIGYKGTKNPQPWMPTTWNQVLIDYASMHAGKPGERITFNEKFKRFRGKRDETFQDLIDLAEFRLIQEVGDVNALLRKNSTIISAYKTLKVGGIY